MILVACCPPGNVSNILTHRAGGDVALSVSMTAVSNLLAIFLMPINMAFWGGLTPPAAAPRGRPAPLADAGRDLPDHRGAVRSRASRSARLPRFAASAHQVVGRFSLLALAAIIVIGVANNWASSSTTSASSWWSSVHDALALPRLRHRSPTGCPREHKAMTFEVGVRNAGPRAAAGVHLLRRPRRDGAGGRLVGHLGHHRRAGGRILGRATRRRSSAEVAASRPSQYGERMPVSRHPRRHRDGSVWSPAEPASSVAVAAAWSRRGPRGRRRGRPAGPDIRRGVGTSMDVTRAAVHAPCSSGTRRRSSCTSPRS